MKKFKTIYIAAINRSGGSLLARLLDNHSKVLSYPIEIGFPTFDNFYEVHETMDGGYFFVSTAGICKIDYDGNAWWDNNSIQGGRTGNITSDGGYIIAGDSDHANANTDPQKILLTKTDSRGMKNGRRKLVNWGLIEL